MSTANQRHKVPNFTVSTSYPFGSHNQTNPGAPAFRWVWAIAVATLPPGLKTRNDHGNHVLIEASIPMTPTALRYSVHGTQASWMRSAPP